LGSFLSARPAGGNDPVMGTANRVDHHEYVWPDLANRFDAHLAVIEPGVDRFDLATGQDAARVCEIESARTEVRLALCQVPFELN
jgi:hypothetical protein